MLQRKMEDFNGKVKIPAPKFSLKKQKKYLPIKTSISFRQPTRQSS